MNLAVVAHADDEILFMGGTLHKYREEGWLIVCVTEDIEHGRDPQFIEVCDSINADYFQLGYEMGWKPHAPKWDEASLRSWLSSIHKKEKWGKIYTHNSLGEYGHPQHVQVYKAMKSLGVPMRVFGVGHPNAETSVILDDDDKAFKQRAADLYTRKAKAIRAYPFFDVPHEEFAEE